MILDNILSAKKKEILHHKRVLPIERIMKGLKKSDKDFLKIIKGKKKKDKNSKQLCIIAEIKRASPSEGTIDENISISEIALEYKNAGADAISILTDTDFFHGNLNDLAEAKIAGLPLLRKDFIIDEYQIYESRYYGADILLLIASILTAGKIDKFITLAKVYGMCCIVEAHTEDDIKKVNLTGAEIIGINNRDLDTLKVDINTTLKLVPKIPLGKIIISESGLKSKIDIAKIKDKVDGALIGTSLLKSGNISEKMRELFK